MTFEPETTTTAFLVNAEYPPLSNYSAENIPAVPDTGDETATWPKKNVRVAKVTPSETATESKKSINIIANA